MKANSLKLILILCFFACLGVLRAADPPETDDETFARLTKLLKGRGDWQKNTLTRLGDRTIQLDSVISLDGDFELIPKIMSNFGEYSRWLIEDINRSPSGRNYYMQVKNVAVDPNTTDIVRVFYSFNLPVFKHIGNRGFRLKADTKPKCFSIQAEGIPHEKSIIESTVGTLRVFKGPDQPERLWVSMRGQLKLRNWIVYEALPERLITREAGERIEIMLKNFQKEEERLKATQAPVKVSGASSPRTNASSK